MRQRFKSAQLDLEVFLVSPRVIRFIPEEFRPRCQFDAGYLRVIFDLTAVTFGKRCRLIKGDRVRVQDLRSTLQRNTVPAEQPGDIKIPRIRHDRD